MNRTSPAQDWLCRALSAAAGWHPPPGPPPAGQWPHLLALARVNRLVPWLSFNAAGQAPPAVQAQLGMERGLANRRALVRAEGLRRLHHLFTEQGIEVVFLKGAAVADILYPLTAERPMHDADVWIRDEAMALRAQALLSKVGLRPTRHLPAGHHHLDPLQDLSEAFAVEIHTNLAAPPLPEPALSGLWSMRGVNSTGLPVLNAVGLFLHHALHALNDPLGGALLRDLWETARLAERLSAGEWNQAINWGFDHGQGARIADVMGLIEHAFARPGRWPARGGTFAGTCGMDRLRNPVVTTWTARLLRNARARALEDWQQHPERMPLFCLLGKVAGVCTTRMLSLPIKIRQGLFPRYQANPMQVLRWKEQALLHDPATGAVYLVNEEAFQAYAACNTPLGTPDMNRLLPSGKTGNEKLAELLKAGILRKV